MKYYPTLNNLIDLNKFPDELDFVKTAINSILDNIYYKDFINQVKAVRNWS